MNNKTTQILIALVLMAGSFYAGMKYDSSKTPTPNMMDGRTGNFTGVRGARGGNGATFGEILSQDANGITVKSQDGSSKIVLISGATTISKQASGVLSDLAVGKFVSVMGTANPDGSITAQTVQLRPASTTQFRQQ